MLHSPSAETTKKHGLKFRSLRLWVDLGHRAVTFVELRIAKPEFALAAREAVLTWT